MKVAQVSVESVMKAILLEKEKAISLNTARKLKEEIPDIAGIVKGREPAIQAFC